MKRLYVTEHESYFNGNDYIDATLRLEFLDDDEAHELFQNQGEMKACSDGWERIHIDGPVNVQLYQNEQAVSFDDTGTCQLTRPV